MSEGSLQDNPLWPVEDPSESEPDALDLSGLRVLVVDDDQHIRDCLTDLLGAYGGTVSSAATVADAKKQLAESLPDVLISDIGLPREDGYSFIASLRTHPAESMRTLPAIALTAFDSPEDRARALAVGFQEHIGKPAVGRTLVETLLSVARRRKA